ncbi:hypothetical protein [uncultured Tolumonas sp.]|uniref:beta strand repeat-containing protein n=1 Tax=uncultured Tolumonas sp. TaxID=263765 RepID=UPI00292E8CF8|nr:hypothetical protein [uncultured Tolumonas sp.]
MNNVVGDNNKNALYGSDGDDSITGLGGDDFLMGYEGNDILDGGDGNDELQSEPISHDGGNKLFLGGAGDDLLETWSGNDTLNGGSGNDYLSAGSGSNILIGGTGNDTIESSISSSDICTNTYQFQKNDGNDTLYITEYSNDIIKFLDVNPSDLKEITLNGSGKYVLNYGLSDSITFKNSATIDSIQFQNGVTWTYADFLKNVPINLTDANDDVNISDAYDKTINGFAGDDYIFSDSNANMLINGGNGSDIIITRGTGADTLVGGLGDDELHSGGNGVFEFSKGDGNDKISGGSAIKFVNVNSSDISLSNNGNNYQYTIHYGTSDSINIYDVMEINKIEFGNGQIWNMEQLIKNTPLELTSADDYIYVNDDYSKTIKGLAGNDDIGVGDLSTEVIMDGGEGNDALRGPENRTSHSTLIGGIGDDYLDGGFGNTVFEFKLGDGNDHINASSCVGTIKFVDVGFTDITNISFDNDNVMIMSYGASDSISVNGYADSNGNGNNVDGVEFKDGTYYSFTGNNQSDGVKIGTDAADILFGGNENDNISGGLGNDFIFGGVGDDTLVGDAGNDIISGGTGNDVLTGGVGSDIYIVDSVGDVVNETTITAEVDTVISSVAYSLGANLENLTLSGSASINGTGNELNNSLFGNDAANVLTGLIGNDTLNGGKGNDTLIGGVGSDTYVVDSAGDVVNETTTVAELDIVQSSVSFLLGANLENLTLTGSAAINGTGNTLNNVITGNSLSNILNGAAGADTLAGGNGSDIYYVDNIGDVVTETNAVASTGGTDLVYSSLSAYTLGANVENGSIQSTGAANLTGNTLNNILYAGAGNNILTGGAGVDTVSYLNASSAISANLTLITAQATGGSGSDTFSGIENLTGSNFADKLTGDAGANILNGAAGADALIGGDGSDTYYVDNIGDVVTETNAVASTGGTDIVYSYLSAYTLGANVENGSIQSTGAANLTGNALNNILYAGAGNNILTGGTGVDTVSYLNASSAISANLTLTTAQVTGGSGSDTFSGIENLTGSNFADKLTGDAGANILNGAAGADALIGGDGSDTYYVDNIGDVVTETNVVASTGGTDLVYSSLSAYTLGANVENGSIQSTGAANLTGNTLNNILYAGAGNNILTGGAGVDTVSYLNASSAISANLTLITAQATGGSGSDTFSGIENLTGSNFADKLTGDAGANILNGAAGADALIGGDGSDTYYVDNIGDVVTETNAVASTGGTDIVYSYLSAYTLGANVENGSIQSTGAANLTGNALNNILYAGAGNNILTGGAGVDTVSYLNASSAISANLTLTTAQVTGGSGSDTFSGIENLTGSNFADKLTGDAGANVLNGGAGADTLVGGIGADTLVGGSGNDIFDFNSLTELGSDTTRDVITDFTCGLDKIDLSTIDANTTLAGDQAFSFVTSFTSTPGQVSYSGGIIYLNTDNDTAAEYQIQLTGSVPPSLSTSDFIL